MIWFLISGYHCITNNFSFTEIFLMNENKQLMSLIIFRPFSTCNRLPFFDYVLRFLIYLLISCFLRNSTWEPTYPVRWREWRNLGNLQRRLCLPRQTTQSPATNKRCTYCQPLPLSLPPKLSTAVRSLWSSSRCNKDCWSSLTVNILYYSDNVYW